MEDWNATTFFEDPLDDIVKRTFSQLYKTQLCIKRVVTRDSNNAIVNTDTPVMGQKWVLFDKNIQKIVMGKYKREVREEKKQWNRCKEHKKLLIAAIWGQFDDDTQARMELSANYKKHWDDGNIVDFLKLLCNIANRR